MNLKVAAAVPVLLIIALGAAIILNQPKVVDSGSDDYVNVNGDEYLNYDYITPDEVGIGDKEVTASADYDVPSTIADCDSLSEGKDNCYSIAAEFTEDERGCAAISDKTTRDDCYAKLAHIKKDPELCSNVSIEYSQCVVDVALEKNDAALCEYGKKDREKCYEAVIANNIDLCPEGYPKAYCNMAIIDNNSAQCGNVVDYSGFCYYSIAMNTNNASLCNKAGVSKDTCFFQIAQKTGNENICENLTETRDNCVAWVAWNTNNRDLCFKAGAESQSCYEELS